MSIYLKERTPIDFLNLFFDVKFYNLLVAQTNLYTQQYREAHPMLPHYSRARQWKYVSVDEMKKFLALYFPTGIVRKPELGQYWSTNPLIKTPMFNEIMSRNCFQAIQDFLHFNDNFNYDPNDFSLNSSFQISAHDLG